METRRSVGRVKGIVGMNLTIGGLERELAIGDRCRVETKKGAVMGEVVDNGEGGTVLLPFGSWDGAAVGDSVSIVPGGDMIFPHDSWVGRVLNALGEPIDALGCLHEGRAERPIKAAPQNAYARRRVGAKLDTGLKVLDVFVPICRGQRMGIFAPSGVGKSSIISMMARNANADVIVIGLVGERGREVQEFIQDDLGEEGMKKSVIVVSTSDEPPLMRRQAAWTAMSVAEHFRDQGKQVLLLMDSVTRFAMAQREIGLSAGEPPTSKGYPPTVFSELPKLLERAGPGIGAQGDITGVFTVLVEGDDHDEPVSDAVRGIMDGHTVLDRSIAESGRYPAVNILRSVSRMLPGCHTAVEYAIMNEARGLLSKFSEIEDMITVGMYKRGSDKVADAAISFHGLSEPYLRQGKSEYAKPEEVFAHLYQMMSQSGVQVPLPAEETSGAEPKKTMRPSRVVGRP